MTMYCKLVGTPKIKNDKVVFKLECDFNGSQKQFLESAQHTIIQIKQED